MFTSVPEKCRSEEHIPGRKLPSLLSGSPGPSSCRCLPASLWRRSSRPPFNFLYRAPVYGGWSSLPPLNFLQRAKKVEPLNDIDILVRGSGKILLMAESGKYPLRSSFAQSKSFHFSEIIQRKRSA